MEDFVTHKITGRSWVSLAVDRIHYLVQLGVDDEKIIKSVCEREPYFFWNTQRRLLVELMVAEYKTATHEGKPIDDHPF